MMEDFEGSTTALIVNTPVSDFFSHYLFIGWGYFQASRARVIKVGLIFPVGNLIWHGSLIPYI